MAPQYPPGFVPDPPTAPPATLPAGFVPDPPPVDRRDAVYRAPNDTDAAGNPIVAGVSNVWTAANTPLIPQIAQAGHAIAQYLSTPHLGDQELNDRFPKLGLGTLAAMARGGGAGMVEGAGDMAASFTSAAGLAMFLAGLGSDSVLFKQVPALVRLLNLPAVRGLQRAVQAAGGAAFATHGAARVWNDPTLGGKALGATEIAAGGLGATSALRSGTPLPVPRITTQEEASNAFARAHNIPLDAATATGSSFLRALQKRVSHSLAGEPEAMRLIDEQGQALTRVGGDLAQQARGAASTPEQAGAGTREILASKAEAETGLADTQYERLRALEADPNNRILVPLPPEAVDKLPPPIRGQLRRIVHEMDASGYKAGKLVTDPDGKSSTYDPRAAGADVYQDIVQELGYDSTRRKVQTELEEYLGGGAETAAVKAALRVAMERAKARGGNTVSKPELPPSAMDLDTRLEAGRVTSQDMGLPVNTARAQATLKPILKRLEDLMPEAQKANDPGLTAIRNIVNAPEWAPLSQMDEWLSALKAMARKKGGIIKVAVAQLDEAVREAARQGGPEVERALLQGRGATIAKVGTEALLDKLPGGAFEEPTAIYRRATADQDASLRFLQQIAKQAPAAIPQIARAKLDELLRIATERGRFDHGDKLMAAWRAMGPETKAILYPDAAHRKALGEFFLLAKRLSENPNPPGTAHVNKVFSDILLSGVTWPLSKILYTPRGVATLTKFLAARPSVTTTTSTLRTAAQTAGWLEVVAAARAAGVPLDLPKAADAAPDTKRTP
jgi:hypothetical protein